MSEITDIKPENKLPTPKLSDSSTCSVDDNATEKINRCGWCGMLCISRTPIMSPTSYTIDQYQAGEKEKVSCTLCEDDKDTGITGEMLVRWNRS